MQSGDTDGQGADLLHQILIVEGFELPAELPPAIAENVGSARARHPTAKHRLWSGGALREMIAENFAAEVGEAFERLRPYAFKADLARYCLLYLYGGIYVDLGMRMLRAFRPPPGVGLATFRDADFLSPSWTAVGCAVVWAKPRRREFEIAIDYVVDNCRTQYYGANSLYPTGPALFGRAMIAAMAERKQQDDADDQWVGVARALTPGETRERICYIAPDLAVVAMRTKWIAADLAHLGVVGANNYDDLWNRRCVYGETPIKDSA